MRRHVCALLVLLASVGVAVGAAAGGHAAAADAAAGLPTTARQAACPALAVPAKCTALEEVLSEREADDALAKVLVHWVVVLIVIRGAVALADEQADKAYRWTTLFAAKAASVVVRFGIVAVSAWQLARSWDNSSVLLETRVLAAAVALDAAVAMVHTMRLFVILLQHEGARALLAADPPTYLFSATTGRHLNATEGGSGPVVLRGHLLVLQREGDYLTAFMRDVDTVAFFSGHSALLWLPLILFSFLSEVVSSARRSAASLLARDCRDSLPDDWLRNAYILPAVSISGHQDDPAAAVLEDHLSPCTCKGGVEYRRPLPSAHYGHSGLLSELETHLRLGLGLRHRRLWTLAHRLHHADQRMCPDSTTAAYLQELDALWFALKSRAPVDGLALNPAACPTVRVRLYALQSTLGEVLDQRNPSQRLAMLLLFGLRLLGGAGGGREDVATLAHGYWWARTPDAALDALPAWLRAAVAAPQPEAAPKRRETAEVPGQRTPPLKAREDRLEVWRHDGNYARPLLDDWGPDDRDLPPAWADLVAADGGLASFAVWGLQPWMVVADVATGGLGDLYLALGRADVGGGVAVVGGDPPADSPASNDDRWATRGDFVAVLTFLQDAKAALARRIERLGAASAIPPLTGEPLEAWPLGFRLRPTTLPPMEAAHLAALSQVLSAGSTVGEVPAALRDVFAPLTPRGGGAGAGGAGAGGAGGSGGGDGGGGALPREECGDDAYRELLTEWHARWARVLEASCERHKVSGAARAAVLKLPLVGWYPAMRLAVDALCGRWAPVAAAVLSRSGVVHEGWPPDVVPRVRLMATTLHECMWTPHRAAVAGLTTSFLLSQTTAIGAADRRLLRVDIDAPDLVPRGTGPLQPAIGFAAVLLTGYAATRSEAGTGDTATVAGTSDTTTVAGTSDTASVAGTSDTASVAGTGDTATVAGATSTAAVAVPVGE